MQKKMAKEQIKSRLLDIFSAYNNGQDVSPAKRFQTEGFVEACISLGAITEQEADDIMINSFAYVFNEPLVMSAEQEFQIPVLMQRAPVYPST